MANTWTDITNAQVAAGAAITSAIGTAFRDNPEGIAQRAPGAPKIFGVPYDFQEFTSSGNWVKPLNAEVGDRVFVQVVGGGQSGQRQSSSFNEGGAGGAGIIVEFDISDLAATEPVVVGAGGAGVSSTTKNDGGASTFGTDAGTNASATGGVPSTFVKAGGGGEYDTKSGGRIARRTTDIDQDYDFTDVEPQTSTDYQGVFNMRNQMFDGGAGGRSGSGGSARPNEARHGGSSLFGGGGGAAINGGGMYSGGHSTYAGCGGHCGANAVSILNHAIDGQFPGGGGGTVHTSLPDDTVSGAGADGVVRVWCVKDV